MKINACQHSQFTSGSREHRSCSTNKKNIKKQPWYTLFTIQKRGGFWWHRIDDATPPPRRSCLYNSLCFLHISYLPSSTILYLYILSYVQKKYIYTKFALITNKTNFCFSNTHTHSVEHILLYAWTLKKISALFIWWDGKKV